MENVTFPGLGLHFEISKVAFQLFGWDIYYYAICIVLGMIVALVLCKNSKDNFYVSSDCLLETMLFAIIFGIIGARAYYVLFNLTEYIYHPIEIFNIRDGGLAIYGGLIGGGITIFYFCKKYRVSPLDFLDYIVPFVALAQAIGRWGNFFNIEAYGYETTSIFRMGIMTDYGYKEVHPVFLYESITNFLIFCILRKMQKNRKFQGQICYTYLFAYAGIRIFLEDLRTDSLMFGGFRISKVLSIFVSIWMSVLLLKKSGECYLKTRRERKRK